MVALSRACVKAGGALGGAGHVGPVCAVCVWHNRCQDCVATDVSQLRRGDSQHIRGALSSAGVRCLLGMAATVARVVQQRCAGNYRLLSSCQNAHHLVPLIAEVPMAQADLWAW